MSGSDPVQGPSVGNCFFSALPERALAGKGVFAYYTCKHRAEDRDALVDTEDSHVEKTAYDLNN